MEQLSSWVSNEDRRINKGYQKKTVFQKTKLVQSVKTIHTLSQTVRCS